MAAELQLPIEKGIGIYGMTEELVTGTYSITGKYNMPYVPMVHCFLAQNSRRVDLTEGNNNGKNKPIDDFLYTEKVIPNISAKDEYLLYRKALKDIIMARSEMEGINIRDILHAREEGIKLLKTNLFR